jgi:hypothetical protein
LDKRWVSCWVLLGSFFVRSATRSPSKEFERASRSGWLYNLSDSLFCAPISFAFLVDSSDKRRNVRGGLSLV